MALTEIDKVYRPIEGVAELADWAEHAPELSNQAIAEAAKTAKDPALAKALSWSKKVNAAIDALPALLDGSYAAYYAAYGEEKAAQFEKNLSR